MKRHALGFLWTCLAPFLFAGCTAGCAAHSLSPAFKGKPTPEASPAPVEKPSILLRVLPQVAQAPAEVRITVLVKDPGGVFYCPSFEVEVEGEVSGREQACPPSSPWQEAYSLQIKNHVFRRPGRHSVEVRVLVGDKVVLAEKTFVLIVGADEDENYSMAAQR